MVCVEQNPLRVNQPNEASKTVLQKLSELHDLCRKCNKTEDFRWRSNTVHDLCRRCNKTEDFRWRSNTVHDLL